MSTNASDVQETTEPSPISNPTNLAPNFNLPNVGRKTGLRVVLITPVGKGVGGIIAHSNSLVGELNRQKLVTLTLIDSMPRYREGHDYRFFKRLWGGGWQALQIGMALAVSIIKFRPAAVELSSSGSIGLVRDLILVALSRMLGTKIFVMFHFGRIPQLATRRNWEWHLLSAVVRLATGVQVLDACSHAVLAARFPRRQILQFPNAIDCDWIDQIRERANDSQSGGRPIRIVFVGMLNATKGVVELVSACSEIRDVAFELEMIGPVGAEMKTNLAAIAAERNVGNWLKFIGVLSREDVVTRVATADIFVLPSYTEGFPNSVLEAMACSVAIVATNVGAIPEMLLDADGALAGVIVPPQDASRLKDALEDLLKNPAKRLLLGQAARRKSEAKYRMSDLARRYVGLWTGRESIDNCRGESPEE